MKRLAFAVPGDLATPTGGYAYDRRIIAELSQLGWNIAVIDLGEGFPQPSATIRAAADAMLSAIAEKCPIVIDGLAFGVLPDTAASLHMRNPLIALVHHPLALETGLSDREARDFRASERAALARTRQVIVTSAATAKILATDYDVAVDRITVARPGTDRAAAMARGSNDGIVRLLAVGSLVPRKGYDVLIAALKRLTELPWKLTIAGDAERDPATAAQIRKAVTQSGLSERVSILGAVTSERLAELYAEADLFVLASRFEGYGMAYAEAIAYGLPVVGTSAGAIPEAVPQEAAVLLTPGDPDALSASLRRLIVGTDERQRLARAARAAAARLPTWRESARLFAGAVEAAT